MRNAYILCLSFILGISCTPKEYEYAKIVNPFIGTDGHGHTYPGATLPFGMVQLSPDTRIDGWDACSGYHYSDTTLLGFSHTHLSGTGAADYGDILITPGDVARNSAIGFNHANEEAWAGYYEVQLENNIDVRLTTTSRVGIHEYSFPETEDAEVSINLKHGIGPDKLLGSGWELTDEDEISGFRRSSGWAKDQRVYFVAQFSSAITVLSAQSDSTRIVISFSGLEAPLIIKVGLSSVSIENAKENISKEAPGWSFETYKSTAEQAWQKELSKVQAEFLSEDDKINFYTALYHSLLAPNTFSDSNGEYRGMDGQTHVQNGVHYSVFSLWDTFRATHPLFTILNPTRNIDMIKSMLDIYKQSGLLPVWELASNETGTMIGYHAIPVITDAILKKEPGFDTDLALEAMIQSANQDHLGLSYYKEMGFIPAEKEHESVSKTLEYAYDDWCIAQVALEKGEDSIYHYFIERAQYYKNLYDATTGFFRPKRNGNWIQEFDPYEVSGNYTEANAWQYNYFVPHDIEGLDSLFKDFGGLSMRLDSLFKAPSKVTGRHQPDIDGMIGQYAHGNEPSHNFSYLYNYVNQPEKTQALVKRIVSELYKNQPNGLSGNEDCGQMSAWYVFSSLGFYPVAPGSPVYTIGTPNVKKASIKLNNRNVFSVTANKLSNENFYVQAAELNGRSLNRSYITHEEIIKGGHLVFTMGNTPASTWNNSEILSPPSKINAPPISVVPVIKSGEMTFLDSATVSIVASDANSEIYFTIDGSAPSIISERYTLPIVLDTTTTVKAISKTGKMISKTVVADFIKIPFGRSISLKHPYSHLYTGNSSMALIDYISGGNNFRDGWQGFHSVDLDAVVDLGEIRKVSEVNIGFLQDHYSWIFFPEWVEISFSIDGRNFTNKVVVENEISKKTDGLITQRIGAEFNRIKAKYVKVVAKNVGKCPDWHKGAGDKAWLFADEIEIKTEQ